LPLPRNAEIRPKMSSMQNVRQSIRICPGPELAQTRDPHRSKLTCRSSSSSASSCTLAQSSNSRRKKQAPMISASCRVPARASAAARSSSLRAWLPAPQPPGGVITAGTPSTPHDRPSPLSTTQCHHFTSLVSDRHGRCVREHAFPAKNSDPMLSLPHRLLLPRADNAAPPSPPRQIRRPSP